MQVRPKLNHSHGRIIGIVSGKGGVGKTFISVNLAAALADAGARVLVFDADLGLANVDLQIGLVPARTITDFLTGRADFGHLVTRSERINCDVIGGRAAAAVLTNTSDEERRRIMDELVSLAGSYGYALIDLAAGIDSNVTDFFDICDQIIVIVRPDPASMMDAYALMKVIPAHAVDRVALVANAAPTSRDGQDLCRNFVDVVAKFLGFRPQILGTIRTDKNVEMAIRRQIPIYAAAPQSFATADIRQLARQVMA